MRTLTTTSPTHSRWGAPIFAIIATAALAPLIACMSDEQDLASDVPETKSLDQLYQDAIAEGGKLVIYSGGDSPTSAQNLQQTIKMRFPLLDVTVRSNLSKYLGATIDNQLARGNLEPDLAILQTLHDFERWKQAGHLLRYKPAGWSEVFPDLKDPGGTYIALRMVTFSNVINPQMTPVDQAPREAQDFLDPKYKGKLIFTYPHDDDAVLYQFDEIIKKYGWGYMDKLLAQEPQWVRSTNVPSAQVASGAKVATFTSGGPIVPPTGAPMQMVLPARDPFLTWGQTGAIFAKAQHPAAAKLYVSWVLSTEGQGRFSSMWSVRQDVPPGQNLKPLAQYPNTSPVAFRNFMYDRAYVESLKMQMELAIGRITEPNPATGQ